MNNQVDRNQLRQSIRARRRQLSATAQRIAAQGLARQLAHLTLFLRAKKIAAYIPNQGELNPIPLVNKIWQRNGKVFLPTLSSNSFTRMRFAPYTQHSKMKPNRFRIPEPVTPSRRLLSAQHLDIVLVPLVAFDRHGNRLGMGGGYYDRTFAFRRDRKHWRKPLLIGLAYDFQEVDALDSEHWDVPLDAVATETRLRWFSHNSPI